MINSILNNISNVTIIATASFASITQEDYRLWLIAIVALLMKLPVSFYQIQKKRIELCGACLAAKTKPKFCLICKRNRPENCPIEKIIY